MNNIKYFAYGALTFLIIGIIIGTVQSLYFKNGYISYEGPGKAYIEINNNNVPLDHFGIKLDYGYYDIKLPNNKIITIHKNSRGNANITIDQEIVLIKTDENILKCYFKENKSAQQGDAPVPALVVFGALESHVRRPGDL